MNAVLRRLTLAQKFIVVVVLALLAAAVPTGLLLKKSLADIGTNRLEARGTSPVIALLQVVQLTQKHRGIAAGMLGGNEALAAKRPEIRAALGKAIDALEASLEAADTSAANIAAWVERKQRWTALEQAVAARQLKPAESSAQHTRLIAEYLTLSDELLDEFGLILDRQREGYAMVVASFVNAPALAERLGQLRAQGTGFLATRQLPPESRAALAALRGRADELFADMMRNLGRATTANPALHAELTGKAERLKEQIGKTLALADQGLIKATELTLPANEYYEDFTRTIDAVYEFNVVSLRNLTRLLDARTADLQHALLLTFAGLLGLMSAAAALAFAAVRAVRRQLGAEPGDAADVAQQVAAGNLEVRIGIRPGDTTSLMAQLKAMQDNLARAVGNVRRGSEAVAAASAEIAAGNNELSGRTEQQAGALEQTAASMEQLSSTVRQNADNAKQANQLALGASTVAVKGGEVVGQVVTTMKGINDSSKRIADIISVIDSIAFQTNILALNAAVEAARAGEQGRGFAVVASEVRSLAQRSADAAKEIKTLITVSVERVEQGTSLVDQAGATMQEIVTSIRRVTDIMGEISSASTEQSAGVAQVGEAITQMDQATQQNAALVEQSAAAAESLKGQAAQLVQAVAVFKIGAGDSAARPTAPSAATPPVAKTHAKPVDRAPSAAKPAGHAQIERRGPNRAKNVTRPVFGATPSKSAVPTTAAPPASVKTGSDDWETF